MEQRNSMGDWFWRIDYFFVSDNLKDNVTDAFTLPNVMGSDHCPVGIEIKI